MAFGRAADVHAQHGHAVVHRAVRRELHAAVGGKRRGGVPGVERGRRERPQGLADHLDDLSLERRRVGLDVAHLLRRHVVGHHQLRVDDRAAVRVARRQQQPLARQAMRLQHTRADAIRHAGRHAEQVERDDDHALTTGVLDGEGLGVQGLRRALGGLGARREARPSRATSAA